ncbi:hypothetical protein OIU84_002879 [Salix udensis]|uniref:Uncharacterized protein n=1 Tax=Salix udensis TaxID=889485 RepID=A0AAD6P5U9_9ROSI|nr:hypothetical protein OIU84_002879 [Salix udensis]
MAKNKRKKAATKLKNVEELRQELVLALKAKLPATSTSLPPSPKQRISAYDSSGSCTSKSSHSNGSLGPNYKEFEDSEEEEDEFSLALCKEDEAYASKFFFSSPMSDKFANDCFVLHESHAQPIVQEEAAMAAAFLVSGSLSMLSAVSFLRDSTSLLAKENVVSSSNDGAAVVISTKGKEKEGNGCWGSFFFFAPLLGNLAARTDFMKEGDVPLLLPTAAGHDSNGSTSSISLDKRIGDNVLPSSPSIAAVNEASMLGKVAGSKAAKTDFQELSKTDFAKTAAALGGVLGNAVAMNGSRDGQASNGKWKDLFSSNRRAESGTKLVSPIEQQSSDEPSRPLTNEEASRPFDCEEPSRAKEVQGSYPLNEFLDEQRVDPMQLETDVGEWTSVWRELMWTRYVV